MVLTDFEVLLISDEDLERFDLGIVKDGSELGPLGEHLLGCSECIERAGRTRQYVETMQGALQFSRPEGESGA